ncbi:MAG: hypothetical protein ACJ71J_07710 [Nitrososphaeraceae archaeon]
MDFYSITECNRDNGSRIAINPDKFDKLITSLRTAVDMMGN